jgi:hypothetical protein
MTATAYAAISNFGREVEITLAIQERDGYASVALPTQIVFQQQAVPEGTRAVSEGPTLSLRHDVAQSLYEALYRLYGPSSVPSDPALKEALTIERARVDRLISWTLEESV